MNFYTAIFHQNLFRHTFTYLSFSKIKFQNNLKNLRCKGQKLSKTLNKLNARMWILLKRENSNFGVQNIKGTTPHENESREVKIWGRKKLFTGSLFQFCCWVFLYYVAVFLPEPSWKFPGNRFHRFTQKFQHPTCDRGCSARLIVTQVFVELRITQKKSKVRTQQQWAEWPDVNRSNPHHKRGLSTVYMTHRRIESR